MIATTRMMTIIIPPTIRYGIIKLFSLIAIRQFGQMVRLESMEAPQSGQVFLAMYSNGIFGVGD
jgi:hypothetical protein